MCLALTNKKVKISTKPIPILILKSVRTNKRNKEVFTSVCFDDVMKEAKFGSLIKDPLFNNSLIKDGKWYRDEVEGGMLHSFKFSVKSFDALSASIMRMEFYIGTYTEIGKNGRMELKRYQTEICVGIIPEGTEYLNGFVKNCSFCLNGLPGYASRRIKVISKVKSMKEAKEIIKKELSLK